MFSCIVKLKAASPEEKKTCVADVKVAKEKVLQHDLILRQLAIYSDFAIHDLQCWDTLIKVLMPFVEHAAKAFELCEGLPTDFKPDLGMVSCVKAILKTEVVKPKLEWLGGAAAGELIQAVKLVEATLDQPATRHIEGLCTKATAAMAKLERSVALDEVKADNHKFHSHFTMAKMNTLKSARATAKASLAAYKPHCPDSAFLSGMEGLLTGARMQTIKWGLLVFSLQQGHPLLGLQRRRPA